MMGWSKSDEDVRADHDRDSRKHDWRPGDAPEHRLDRKIGTPLEIAALVKDVDIIRGAQLIELYASTVAEAAKLDLTIEFDARTGGPVVSR